MAARQSPNTIRAYRRDIAAFRAFIGKPIRLAYLGDLQRYADALVGSPASCARRLLVVKSLLSFAARTGFTPFNIGAAKSHRWISSHDINQLRAQSDPTSLRGCDVAARIEYRVGDALATVIDRPQGCTGQQG